MDYEQTDIFNVIETEKTGVAVSTLTLPQPW